MGYNTRRVKSEEQRAKSKERRAKSRKRKKKLYALDDEPPFFTKERLDLKGLEP